MNSDSEPGVILCVDDEPSALAIRKMLLESQGYRVLTAPDGPQALQLFATESIDLVVLDYKMPGMNGDLVAQAMKEANPSIPILMLSAYVDLPIEAYMWVNNHLTKGQAPDVFLKAIKELLRDKHTDSTAALAK